MALMRVNGWNRFNLLRDHESLLIAHSSFLVQPLAEFGYAGKTLTPEFGISRGTY
jgi:hypothetical protein